MGLSFSHQPSTDPLLDYRQHITQLQQANCLLHQNENKLLQKISSLEHQLKNEVQQQKKLNSEKEQLSKQLEQTKLNIDQKVSETEKMKKAKEELHIRFSQEKTKMENQWKQEKDKILKENEQVLNKERTTLKEQHEEEINSLKTKFNEKYKKKEQEFLTEKENWLKEKQHFEEEVQKLTNDLLKLRIETDPNTITNDFTERGPQSVCESFLNVKSELQALVEEISQNCQLSEVQTIEMEAQISESIFKTLLPQIKGFVTQYHQNVVDDQSIGKIIKESKELQSQLVSNTELGLTRFIHEKLQSDTSSNNMNLGNATNQENLSHLCQRVILFFADMMMCEKKFDLVWCKKTDTFNPYEHKSTNQKETILIETVLYPCLMIPTSRTVFERAVVITKNRKLK
nr:unnamed protein product [Naegleria fowleri]